MHSRTHNWLLRGDVGLPFFSLFLGFLLYAFLDLFTFSFFVSFFFYLILYQTFLFHSFFLLSLKISSCILPLFNPLFLFHTPK